MFEVLTTNTSACDLIWEQDHSRGHQLSQDDVTPQQSRPLIEYYLYSFFKRGNLETDVLTGRISYEDEVRDWGAEAKTKEYKNFPANHQKLGEWHETDSLSQPLEEPALQE